jgi:hypothetical protein
MYVLGVPIVGIGIQSKKYNKGKDLDLQYLECQQDLVLKSSLLFNFFVQLQLLVVEKMKDSKNNGDY